MRRAWLAAVAMGSALAGCGGDYGLRCENPERYAGAEETPPLRVPDDLDVPDETRALRIPPVPRGTSRVAMRRGPCLESPPAYTETDAGEPAPDPGANASGP